MRLLGTLRRRWFAVVLAVMFLQQLAIMALRPMTSYRALELGAGPAGLGLVAGSFAAAAVICAVPVGRLIDRHGEGRFAVAGIAALGAAGFASAFAPNLAALVAVQAAMGLAHLANMVALQTMLANAEDDLGSAERFGRFTVVASLGQLAGPALAGLVAGGGTRAGFILGSVAALLGAVVAYRSGRRTGVRPGRGRRPGSRSAACLPSRR